MMTGYEVYQQYVLIKAHFTSDTFDATKYKRTSAKKTTYEKRNDKAFFEYLSKRFQDRDIKPFFISNMIFGEKYIIEMVDDLDTSIRNFRDWKKRMGQLSNLFGRECIDLREFMHSNDIKFDDLFKASRNKYPIILRLMLEDHITLETYILLNKVLTFTPRFDKMYTDDHVYDEIALRVKKYSYYFKSIDLPPYRQIMKDIFISQK